MKLLILGASRGIGRLAIDIALARGHEVTAVARTDPGIEPQPGLRRFFFDVRDLPRLKDTVPGHDAVIWTVGLMPERERVTLFSEGTAALTDMMRLARMRRLIVVTGVGAGDSRGHGTWFYNTVTQPYFLRTIYEDKDRQEVLVAACGLDWTIVRPGFLTNAKPKGRLKIVTDLGRQRFGSVPRADVAELLVKLAEDGSHKGAILNVWS